MTTPIQQQRKTEYTTQENTKTPRVEEVAKKIQQVIDNHSYRDTISYTGKTGWDNNAPFGGGQYLEIESTPCSQEFRVQITNQFGWESSKTQEHLKKDPWHSHTVYNVINCATGDTISFPFQLYKQIVESPTTARWDHMHFAKLLGMV